MRRVIEGLYQSKFEFPFGPQGGCQSAAYLLVNSAGNTLFYSSSYIEDHFDFITQQGGVSFQMLNHRHEASPHSNKVLDKFNAPLICHHLEKEAVSEHCKVGQTIYGGEVFGNINVIHTPGHCHGSTCFFVVTQNNDNILFSGDTFYPKEGEWRVAIFKEYIEETIMSLKKLSELDVSIIVPSLYVGYPSVGKFEDKNQYRSVIADCIARLERGETH